MPLRSKQDYLASLRDGRRIVADGRVVEDVTAEPGFRRTAESVGDFFAFRSRPELLETMSFETEDGDRAGMGFLEPRSKEDLEQRAAAVAAWAEATAGFFGRSPDYMNAFVGTMAALAPRFAQLHPEIPDRIRNMCVELRRSDACLTHTFVNPFSARDEDTQARRGLKLDKATDEGYVVSGARGIATLAPFANANLNMEAGRKGVYVFVSDVASDGCHWICRDVLAPERSALDSPFAQHLEEMDCLGVFDRCEIPTSRTIAILPPERAAEAAGLRPILDLAHTALDHHMLVRRIAKTRFLIALAHLVVESSKVNVFANVKEILGEMVLTLKVLQAFASNAVSSAVTDPESGAVCPDPAVMKAASVYYAINHPKLLASLRELAGGRPISAPPEATIDTYTELLEDHLRVGDGDARDNVGLFRLVWETTSSSWAIRQDVYEQFALGPKTMRLIQLYDGFEKNDARALVESVLEYKTSGS